MTAHVSEITPYRQLVDQCWGLLKGSLSVAFPSSSRSHPSRQVWVVPIGVSYPWDFWQGVVVPTLDELVEVTPPYEGGWNNPMARTLVDGYLRRTLQGSAWAPWVNFNAT